MVAAQWRLRRIWSMQTAALDLKMDQQEAEIAEKFTSIDQPTRATVAFTTLANEEKSLELLSALRNHLHPHVRSSPESPVKAAKRKFAKRPKQWGRFATRGRFRIGVPPINHQNPSNWVRPEPTTEALVASETPETHHPKPSL